MKDVERIYHSNELNSDITKVFSLIIGISHRYSYRFKKFESKEQIPKEYRSNKSTDLFINGLIDKLINEGLSTSRINLENLEEYNKFKSALSSTLYNLKQIKDQEKVFKLNMIKIIYKKLLERDQVWPEDILNILKNNNDEYF